MVEANTNEGNYPQREKFFACSIVRDLFDSGAAQEIGHHAVCLVILVAHKEDLFHYRGAVNFWNSQLMTSLGFTSPKQLNSARKKAVDAGWLHYERGNKRSVGVYWVCNPFRSSVGTNRGKNSDSTLSPCGTNPGTNPGKPPTPKPIPKPNPTQTCLLPSARPDDVYKRWNESSASTKVLKLNDERRKKLRTRLKDPDWPCLLYTSDAADE